MVSGDFVLVDWHALIRSSFTQQIKPDGVQRGLVGSIVARFESKGYKLVAMKTKQADAELLAKHYSELTEKPFFPRLRDYMLSGPVRVCC